MTVVSGFKRNTVLGLNLAQAGDTLPLLAQVSNGTWASLGPPSGGSKES